MLRQSLIPPARCDYIGKIGVNNITTTGKRAVADLFFGWNDAATTGASNRIEAYR